MTLDDLVIRELGRAQLQAMRDALEKQALKDDLAAKGKEVQALTLALRTSSGVRPEVT